MESFVRDDSPDAYERLVSRLLASPHFGERYGRYWLDLARFAETSGYERDQEKPGAWRYRDWVVRAFNQDKPYDRFVCEQLAGDEFPDRDIQTVIATGFLRLGTWNDEPNDPQDYKYERIEDLVHATTTAFLGMTVKCARCHDHKFDPIPQRDYYRIAAVFWPGPIEPRDRELLGGPTRDELGFDVLGWTDVTRTPSEFHLLKKGEYTSRGRWCRRGCCRCIPSLDRPFSGRAESARTTERRLKLAEWITDPRHPLSARVYVNRLWQHHFGRGLVSSVNNFGFSGQKPSHPELLDWLADEFVRGGWTSKKLHYLMMTSRAYQQTSVHPEQESYAVKDPENQLLWRGTRRRLDAEALRDAILASSGRLDLRLGGPSFRPVISQEALEGLSQKGRDYTPSPASRARPAQPLHVFPARAALAALDDVRLLRYDAALRGAGCERGGAAGAGLDERRVRARTEPRHCASGLSRAGGQDRLSRINAAWRIVLARAPSKSELRARRRSISNGSDNSSGVIARQTNLPSRHFVTF